MTTTEPETLRAESPDEDHLAVDELPDVSNLNVHEAVRRVRAELRPIPKSRQSGGRDSTMRYSYRGIDDVVDGLAALTAKWGVEVTPSGVEVHERAWVTDANGRVERHVCATYTFEVRGPLGDGYPVTVYAEGLNSRDKASGSAFSYAHRYALTSVFMIPTGDDDDPEARDHGNGHRPRQPRPPAGPISDEQAQALADLFATIADPTARTEAKAAFVERYANPADVKANHYAAALKWAAAKAEAANKAQKATRAAHSDAKRSPADPRPDTAEPETTAHEGSTPDDGRDWLVATFIDLDPSQAEVLRAALTEAGYWPIHDIADADLFDALALAEAKLDDLGL